MAAVDISAQEYSYEWLALGSTADMSTSQTVSWRTEPEDSLAYAQIAVANVSPDIKPTCINVKATSGIKDDYGTVKCYHSVLFDGLEPQSKYLYRIGNGRDSWSEWFEIKTASKGFSPYSFIFMADVQSGIMDQYPRVIRHAVTTAPDAAFIVFSGDLTERALDWQYSQFFKAHGWILAQKAMVAVPDNHEYPMNENNKRKVLGTWWDHMFNHPHNAPARLDSKGFFTMDYQNCRFICLNTREFSEFTEDENEMAFEWIENLLKDNPCKWTIVVQHKPVYSVADKRHSDRNMLRKKALYEKYGVDLVVSGHDHIYSRTATKDVKGKPTVPVCVSSVGGSGQYAPSYSGVHDRIGSDCEFYQVVDITEDRMEFKTYDALGDLYDCFRIEKTRKGKKVVDLAPERPMRTGLPATRKHKYTDAEWQSLDSLRIEFNKRITQ